MISQNNKLYQLQPKSDSKGTVNQTQLVQSLKKRSNQASLVKTPVTVGFGYVAA